MPVTGEILERQRDLARQNAALAAESNKDVVFQDMTPREPPVTIYSMRDGEPIQMAPHIARMAMAKQYTDGRYLFTADPSKAPEYKLGKHKCFLHPESAARESGLLEAAGIEMFVCPSQHHPSKYAMEEVAKAKHSKQWAALQAYILDQEKQEEKAERRQQLEATLALAGKAAGTMLACPECGAEFETARQLHGHKLGAHKG